MSIGVFFTAGIVDASRILQIDNNHPDSPKQGRVVWYYFGIDLESCGVGPFQLVQDQRSERQRMEAVKGTRRRQRGIS